MKIFKNHVDFHHVVAMLSTVSEFKLHVTVSSFDNLGNISLEYHSSDDVLSSDTEFWGDAHILGWGNATFGTPERFTKYLNELLISLQNPENASEYDADDEAACFLTIDWSTKTYVKLDFLVK